MKKFVYLLLAALVLTTACSKDENKEIIVDDKYTNYSDLDTKISYNSTISKDNKLFVFLMNNNEIDVDVELLIVSADFEINETVYSLAANTEYVFIAESKDIKDYSVFFDTKEAKTESRLKDIEINETAEKAGLEINFKNISEKMIDEALWAVIYYKGNTIVAHDFLIISKLDTKEETILESPYPNYISSFDHFEIVPFSL